MAAATSTEQSVPRPRRRIGAGVVALCVLAAMFFACVLTLPYTFGRVREAGGAAVPRFNAGSPSLSRMPPAFLARDADQTARARDSTERWLLGTDALGRSLLLRLLAGGGVSLTIGLLATALSVSIGTLYGALSGYAGGRVDALLMRIVDVLYGLPYVLLVVLLAVASDAVVSEYVSRHKERTGIVLAEARETLRAQGKPADAVAARDLLASDAELRERLEAEAMRVAPPRLIAEGTRTFLDLSTLLFAIGGVSWLTMARVVRGQVLSLRNQPFVEAARALGLSPWRIFARHVLPNLSGTIIVYATLTVPQAILQESFLSFLGIGVRPPLPSWGNLAAEGLGEINPYQSDWWLLVFPCLALAATLLSLNFVGEWLRERFDPKRATR